MTLGPDQYDVAVDAVRARVTLIGEFDDFNADDLEGSLGRLLIAPPPTVELETARVTYVSSTALRTLIAFHDNAASVGVSVVITEASYVVRRLIEVVGLTAMFGMTDDG